MTTLYSLQTTPVYGLSEGGVEPNSPEAHAAIERVKARLKRNARTDSQFTIVPSKWNNRPPKPALPERTGIVAKEGEAA